VVMLKGCNCKHTQKKGEGNYEGVKDRLCNVMGIGARNDAEHREC